MTYYKSMKTETRQVLAGAYRGGRQVFLTHLAWVDSDDNTIKVGCRQPLDNLADSYSDPDGLTARPTCPTCAKKWDKVVK